MFKFLLISDRKNFPEIPANAEVRHFTVKQIIQLASEKLGFNLNLSQPLKLCDLKPAYGKIFEQWLEGYDYWGYCDIDLVLGNLAKFILPLYEEEPDVISFYPEYMSGPFCLYRTGEKTINLYARVPSYRDILQSPGHFAFDENVRSRSGEISRARKLGLKARYLMEMPFKSGITLFSPPEMAYRFQWYLKKRTLCAGPPVDMTDLVLQEQESGGLSTRFADLMRSDREFSRRGRKNWRLVWDNGTLWDEVRKRELLGFHFVELKNSRGFQVPHVDRIPDRFRLTQKGFEL